MTSDDEKPIIPPEIEIRLLLEADLARVMKGTDSIAAG